MPSFASLTGPLHLAASSALCRARAVPDPLLRKEEIPKTKAFLKILKSFSQARKLGYVSSLEGIYTKLASAIENRKGTKTFETNIFFLVGLPYKMFHK